MVSSRPAPPAAPAPSDPDIVWLPGRPFGDGESRGLALVGIPESATPVPGIVLVHGGGGTAYRTWVRQWAERGYAAIAVDTSWRIPSGDDEHSGTPEAHAWPGPTPWDGTFGQPVHGDEQWLTHAMALIDGARRRLADDPRVDAARIALMGVSWGGFLTCIASAALPGFACAVSVYGCGFLTEESAWLSRGAFDALDPAQVSAWTDTWDPRSWLGSTQIPILFLTGVADDSYPLVSVDRSAALAPRAQRSYLPALAHSHNDAWEPQESARFIDAALRGGDPLPPVPEIVADGSRISARVPSDVAVTVRLLHTTDTGDWQHRIWQETPAAVASGLVEASVPDAATAWFLNVVDDRGATTSSPLMQR
jgi:dienelactone hydrolase